MEIKNLVTLVIFSMVAFLLAFRYPSNNELKWYDWNEGYEIAKKKNKIILVDAYTDWCGWCKKMDKDTYAKKNVISYINKHFVPIKFNPELKGQYNVSGNNLTPRELLGNLSGGQNVGYPTTFFLSLEKNQV
ncbi:MAG: thioredoxin family protein, partial [Bacteroidia bacterium]